jgi:tripeptide aminopeptidase
MTSVKNRFLQYVRIATTSSISSETTPSTSEQFDLAKLLVEQMKSIGLQDVVVDEKCYVMATLPANITKVVPVIGFIAHLDTATETTGKGVNPQIVQSYDGGNIVLNKEKDIVISPELFPELQKYKGQELITTDGNTLLGADDKAGVAEIMAAMEYLMQHPEIKHGKIRVAFTPDEEVGRGADHFDVKKFGAEFAYTVDGGEIGELEYETFNAAQGAVLVKGRNVHPGNAKNKMVNSALIAMEFTAMLPVNERPEFTEGREGFFHLMSIEGGVEETKMAYLIRDHDRKIFEHRKEVFLAAGEYINKRYGAGTIEVTAKDIYYNMREMIEPVFHIVELAMCAYRDAGIEPIVVPVRGGTDGSRLSYMGLPCPNLFTGGLYYHGRYECIPSASMEKSVEVIVNIITLLAER